MKFGTIGCGKMGRAIISQITSANIFKKSEIYVYEVDNRLIASLSSEGYQTAQSIDELFSACDVVLFAVKPQEAKSVISSIGKKGNCKLVLSIMAGVPISLLEKIDDGLAVARIMPNTCAQIGESASSICYNKNVDENLKALTRKIFGAIGKFVEIDESLMDDVIPLGGSFTAFAYTFMKAFVDYAMSRGISENVAKELVVQSMIGSAKMVERFDDIDTLIKNVCSKGGTTLAGLDELEKGNFSKVVQNCAIACAERSKELGKID